MQALTNNKAALEDIASAIAVQAQLDHAECSRAAQFILEGTARQIRKGQYMIVHHPDRLSQPSDGDDFMKLVRSLPKETAIHDCSNHVLWASRQPKRP